MKASPGTSSVTFFFNLPSDRLVQLVKPPMEVTVLLPMRTWLEALTVAWKPRAVLLVTGMVASAKVPINVLEKLFWEKPAPTPNAALLLPEVLRASAAPPVAVLFTPEIFEYIEL